MWNSTRVSAFVWIFALLLLQNTLHFIFPSELFPFLLIAVIFYALSEGPFFGFVVGCYAGFFLDLLGIGRLGPQMLIYGTVGIVSGWSASTLFRDSLWTQLFFPFAANLFILVLDRFVYADFLAESGGAMAFFGRPAEWRALLGTILISPTVFRFLRSVSFTSHERSLRWR